MSKLPEGFQSATGIAWGSRAPGCLEIKFHNPKMRNAMGKDVHMKMKELINNAQDDKNVKMILIHGGKFFGSGNDISALAASGSDDPATMRKNAEEGVGYCVENCIAMSRSRKPIVAVCRGGALGISYTILTQCDFIYCDETAYFKTPFGASCQSPEGSSTISFPQQLGKRLTSEVLLLDRQLTAKDMLGCGFINGIIPELNNEPDFFDYKKVPTIGKLLDSDYRTIVNSMDLLKKAKDNEKIEKVLWEEGKALVDCWMEPEFPPKLANYMMKLMEEKAAKKANKAKL